MRSDDLYDIKDGLGNVLEEISSQLPSNEINQVDNIMVQFEIIQEKLRRLYDKTAKKNRH